MLNVKQVFLWPVVSLSLCITCLLSIEHNLRKVTVTEIFPKGLAIFAKFYCWKSFEVVGGL